MSERDVSPSGLPFPVRPRLVIIAIIVVVLIALVVSSFYVVDQTEEGVVLRFGQYYATTSPGLQFKLPFGIDKNINVPTQVVQTLSFGFRTERPGITSTFSRVDYPEESIMLTGDLNIVDVEWTVQYRIVDPKAWLFNVEQREKTIRDISQSVVNQLVGDRAILDVIGQERANIEVAAQQSMNDVFKEYALGINVTTVKLRNIVPPQGQVQDAFEEVNKSVQDMNRLINEGKEAYNKEIPKARGQAEALIQEAKGYASERVNEARGDVARFNSVAAEYAKNRSVTRTRLYIEMIEDVFKDEQDTDLIDKNLENFIPLKTLESQTRGGTE